MSEIPLSDVPVVAKGMCASWPACKLWNLDYLDSKLDCPLKFRLGKRAVRNIQWETKCPVVFASVSQFRDWTSGCADQRNPLSPYHFESWWAYADYIHMTPGSDVENLKTDLEFPQTFGIVDPSLIPTFWLASSGAYSICHYDTYGINLVVQVSGQKKWTLFPSFDEPNLYSTRLPFEESTVFSQVNFPEPDLSKYPLVFKTSPHCVLLNPGDVLFVPRGWWHFVQSTELSTVTCSVNLWLDEPELDDSCRLREALTQFAAFSLLSNTNLDKNELLHSDENDLYNSGDWSSVLLQNIKDLAGKTQSDIPTRFERKKVKRSNSLWSPVIKCKFEECFSDSVHTQKEPKSKRTKVLDNKAILNAFLKADVLDLVARHLERQFF
ncbi:Heat shock proteinB1 associated protein 1 [Fasciolopsis buskii]|uniref:Heat shock proteinB1 associated protein 1 n=1 Tax=Fasciolopsis buskii TaxID=27845 RepID=A0A8E0RQV6_9TREM|nr:Heat shock proteinB1 associated protein 1 [Fasciolopsis buski]